jgi:hypothetical protein
MNGFYPLCALREETMPKDWKKPDRFWKKTKDVEKNEGRPPPGKKKRKLKLKLSIPSKKKRTRQH